MLFIAEGDYMTPAAIEEALFMSTCLKYWDDTKEETITVSNKKGVHAEERMLANVYKNAWIELELKKQKLQAEEEKTRKACSKESELQARRHQIYQTNKGQLNRVRKEELEIKDEEKRSLIRKKKRKSGNKVKGTSKK